MTDAVIPFDDAQAIPVLVADQLTAPFSVPISIFSEFKSPAGIPAFGGAKVVSIFEDGVAEGVTTTAIQAVTQQPLESVGSITVAAPNEGNLYAVRIRVRSDVSDPNYRDRVVRFRLHTPIGAPYDLALLDDDDVPGLTGTLAGFQFTAPAGAMPVGATSLVTGRGSLALPSVAAVNFGVESGTAMLAQLSKLRASLIQIDVAPAAGVEAWTRLTYTAVFDSESTTWAFSLYRRADFASHGYFASDTVDFVRGAIDMAAKTASLTFLRGLYASGPKFLGAWVAGSRGSMPLNTQQMRNGAEFDVASVIDFSAKSHLSRTGVLDRFLLLGLVSQDKTIVQEIPLRLQGNHDLVTQDGVTNFFTDAAGGTLPTVQPLFCRLLIDPYLEFPNFTQYYDPSSGFLPNPSTLAYPRVQNLRFYAGNAATPNQTYTDIVALHKAMTAIPLPTQGVTRFVVDMRDWTTAPPPGTTWLRCVMEIDEDGVEAPYDIECTYELTPDGRPVIWKTPLQTTPDAPDVTFDPTTQALMLVIATGSAVQSDQITLRGDVGAVADLDTMVTINNPGTTVVPASVMGGVISPDAELLDVEFDVSGSGRFIRRVGLLVRTRMLVVGGVDITTWFTGTTLVTGDISSIDVNGDGKRAIVIAGDGWVRTIRDAQNSAVYNLDLAQPASLINPVRQTWVDLLYVSGTVRHTLRVFNELFDARVLAPRTIVHAPTGLLGASQVMTEEDSFSVPRVAYDLLNRDLLVESDSRVYDFDEWFVRNLSTRDEARFIGTLQPGRAYQLGAVLADAETQQELLFGFRHKNGVQKFYVGAVRASTDGFQSLRRLTLTGTL